MKRRPPHDAVRHLFDALYRRIVLCLIAGFALSSAIYRESFGLPVVGFGWHQTDYPGDPLRVLGIFAPGWLVLAPLLAPSVRNLVRRDKQARDDRRKVAVTLAIWWCLAFLTWEYGALVQQLEGLAVIPGHRLAAALLPFEAGLLALLSIGGLSWEPSHLVYPVRSFAVAKRIWARFAWLAYTLFAGAVVLALQVPSGWPP